MTTTPAIPPRPIKSANTGQSANVPQVPSRPVRRSVERSISPNRDSFARSPLHSGGLSKVPSIDGPSGLSRELPARPPSVSLPSVGQEGSEYDHAVPVPEKQQQQVDPLAKAARTSSVSNELPLHAPKASLPVSSAKARIAAVTRTDSSQAAALGIGKAPSANASETDLSHTLTRSTSRQSQTRSRPPSLYKQEVDELEEREHGIPNIGLQVPMYPGAGDVQAPTPSPGMPPPSTGVGFFNNVGSGSHTPKNHSRTKSGREVFHGPPGSYGMHGYGVNKTDPFEKAWYDKHPDAFAREVKGEYGPAISEDRREWALSSEELNNLVHTKSHPSMGATSNVIGTPAEDIGYIASEEYAQRLASRPGSAKPRRPSSQTFQESPLRTMSVSASDVEDANKNKNDHAMESEVEDEVIHVDMPRSPRRFADNKPTENLGQDGGNTSEKRGYYLETGNGLPILASDESAFRPDAQYLQPAIEPVAERRNSSYLDLSETLNRPQSRTSSINKIAEHHLSHVTSRGDLRPDSIGTPLENVREYEPLFDSDEDEPRSSTAPAAIGSPDRKKKTARPDLARHHFPSQDVWEDAPDSLNHVTTVDSPQLPDNPHRSAEHEPSSFFETPEAEAARKSNLTAKDQENFLPKATKNLANYEYKPEVLGQVTTRPGHLQHRFPSQDIWEDTPGSSMHTTVLDNDHDDDEEEEEEDSSPLESKQPQVPSRPIRKSEDEVKQAPIIPGRPKPSVPARPSKLKSSEGSDDTLTKTTSKDSGQGAPGAKTKPAVPARPGGSKIAALQAGFMSDLNKKLGLGPQAPKKDEPEPEVVEERAPLADARKGRARGPQRRRAAGTSPSGQEEPSAPPSSSRPIFKFTISRPQTIWEVDEGVLSVPIAAPSFKTARAVSDAAQNGTPAAIELSQERDEGPNDESKILPGAFPGDEPELEQTSTKESGTSTETAVQTGETQIESTDTDNGETAKHTAYVGGRAPDEGTVVVDEDGKELGSSAA